MADPLTALASLGLAANVAQFVEYRLKIIARNKEVYRDIHGATEEHKSIEEVVVDLQESTRNISGSLPGYNDISTDLIQGRDDTRLIVIAEKSDKIAATLIDHLEGLHVGPGQHRTFRSA